MEEKRTEDHERKMAMTCRGGGRALMMNPLPTSKTSTRGRSRGEFSRSAAAIRSTSVSTRALRNYHHHQEEIIDDDLEKLSFKMERVKLVDHEVDGDHILKKGAIEDSGIAADVEDEDINDVMMQELSLKMKRASLHDQYHRLLDLRPRIRNMKKRNRRRGLVLVVSY